MKIPTECNGGTVSSGKLINRSFIRKPVFFPPINSSKLTPPLFSVKTFSSTDFLRNFRKDGNVPESESLYCRRLRAVYIPQIDPSSSPVLRTVPMLPGEKGWGKGVGVHWVEGLHDCFSFRNWELLLNPTSSCPKMMKYPCTKTPNAYSQNYFQSPSTLSILNSYLDCTPHPSFRSNL